MLFFVSARTNKRHHHRRREKVRGVYRFSSLVKQNKKAKICFVIHIARERKIIFYIYALIVKQKKKSSANHYSGCAEQCHVGGSEPFAHDLFGDRRCNRSFMTAQKFYGRAAAEEFLASNLFKSCTIHGMQVINGI